MSFSFNHPYSLQGTSFQDPGAATDATYDVRSLFPFVLYSLTIPLGIQINSPFDFVHLPFYHYPDFDFQHQSPYAPHEPIHDSYGHPSINSAPPMNDSRQYHALTQDIHIPQTSQCPPAPVYPSSSSAQLPLVDRGESVYEGDSRSARPTLGRVPPDGTARTELPNGHAGRHSHPSPVATSPSLQNPAAGPSRPSPSSPERKRVLPLSADEELSVSAVCQLYTTVQLTWKQIGRRVIPRSDRASSVHSTSSDSHRRNHSTDIGRGPFIPQDRYRTSSISTYNTAEQHPHITFELDNPNQIGIPIIDILNRVDGFDRIRDRAQAFSHMGKKTFTLRVQVSWSDVDFTCG